MNKFKKPFATLLSGIFVLSTLSTNVSAAQNINADKNVNITTKISKPKSTEKRLISKSTLPNGQIEEIYMNENREIFVNGRNITSITPITNNSMSNTNIMPDSYSIQEDWTYAGYFDYKYDLFGVTLSGGYQICRSLGLTITQAAFTSIASNYLVNAVFQPGVYIKDRRHTYYKNINQPRPDMKEEHDVYFVAEILTSSYEKYLGSFTTYGGL